MTRPFLVLLVVLSALPVQAEEPLQDPFVRVLTGGHTVAVLSTCVSRVKRRLWSAGLDKVVRVWDLETGEQVGVLRIPIGPGMAGAITAVAVTADGSRVAVGALRWDVKAPSPKSASMLYVLDGQTGRIIGRHAAHASVVRSLAFSFDGTALLSVGWSDNRIKLWDVGRQGVLAQRLETPGVAAAWVDTKLFATGSSDRVTIWRRVERTEMTSLRLGDSVVKAIATGPGGGIVAVTDREVVSWRPGQSGLEVVAGGFDFANARHFDVLLDVSPDGRIAVTRREGHEGVALLPGGKRAPFALPAKRTRVQTTSWYGGTLLVADSFGAIHRLAVDPATRAQLPPLHGPSGPIVAIGTGPGVVAWGTRWERDEANRHGPLEHAMNLTDLLPGLLSKDLQPAAVSRDAFGLTLEGNALVIRNGARETRFEPEGRIRAFTLLEGERVAVATSRGIHLFDAADPESTEFLVGHEAEVFALAPYDRGRLLVSGSADRTIRFWDIEKKTELVALYTNPETREWVAWTPQGYYACSTDGDKLVGWHINGKGTPAFFLADTMRERLYQPAIIRQVLGAGSLDEAIRMVNKERARRRGGVPLQVEPIRKILPPLVRIIHPEPNARIKEKTVKVEFEVARGPSGRPVTELIVEVNGIPYRRTVNKDSIRGDQPTRLNVEIEVAQGSTTIAVVAFNDASESSRESLTIHVPKGARLGDGVMELEGHRSTTIARSTREDRPDSPTGIAALCVGAEKYALEKDFPPLDFGEADAKKMADAFRLAYPNAPITTLLGAQVTRTSVINAINSLGRKLKKGGLIFIYFAGHGHLDKAISKYYYIPPGLESLESLDTDAVSSSDLQDSIERISKNGAKVILMLDTCRAGSVARARISRSSANPTAGIKAFQSVKYGTVVLSGTGGRGYSWEVGQLGPKLGGGGIFTESLVQAIRGGADVDDDRTIWLFEFNAFVAAHVRRIVARFKGLHQEPEISTPGTADYPICKLP